MDELCMAELEGASEEEDIIDEPCEVELEGDDEDASVDEDRCPLLVELELAAWVLALEDVEDELDSTPDEIVPLEEDEDDPLLLAVDEL